MFPRSNYSFVLGFRRFSPAGRTSDRWTRRWPSRSTWAPSASWKSSFSPPNTSKSSNNRCTKWISSAVCATSLSVCCLFEVLTYIQCICTVGKFPMKQLRLENAFINCSRHNFCCVFPFIARSSNDRFVKLDCFSCVCVCAHLCGTFCALVWGVGLLHREWLLHQTPSV